jgi:hypothetical protein
LGSKCTRRACHRRARCPRCRAAQDVARVSGCRREAVCTEVQTADRDRSGPRAKRVLRSRGAEHRCCTNPIPHSLPPLMNKGAPSSSTAPLEAALAPWAHCGSSHSIRCSHSPPTP